MSMSEHASAPHTRDHACENTVNRPWARKWVGSQSQGLNTCSQRKVRAERIIGGSGKVVPTGALCPVPSATAGFGLLPMPMHALWV